MLSQYLAEQFDWRRYQVLVYVLGVVFFAFGARIFIDAKLGTDPLDTLVIGINNHLSVGLGMCSALVASFFLCWWMIWNRRLPPLSPFVTTTAVGFILDLLGAADIRRLTVDALPTVAFSVGSINIDLARLFAVIAALMLCAYASSLIIMSGIGIRIMDLVAITMVERLGWSFFRSKMTLEIGLFTTGYILGGPIGITTILFLLFVGPFIQPFMWTNKVLLGIPNHGLRSQPIGSGNLTDA